MNDMGSEIKKYIGHFALNTLIIMLGFQLANAQLASDSLQVKRLTKDCTFCQLTIQVYDSVVFTRSIAEHKGIGVRAVTKNVFLVTGTPSALEKLVRVRSIRYIDRGSRKASPETILGDHDVSANAAGAAKAYFPTVDGSNLALSIKEKPFDPDDIDLKGRVIVTSAFDEDLTLHATLMATIAAGAGNSSSNAEGIAKAVKITTADYDNLFPDDGNNLTSLAVSVQNHSYGVGLENYYGLESRAYDQASIDFPKIVHIFSSGNEGDQTPSEGGYANIQGYANLTGQFKTSKNVITVGSVDRNGVLAEKSSRGPAYDGRVKPEVVAYGDAGSSESAAIVSGASILIQDAYQKLIGNLPDAELVRAVLINSADDVGRPGLDFECGYGNVNVKKAIETVVQETFFEAEVSKSNLTAGFELVVPASTSRLKVTLAWSDPPAEPFNNKALVNDLNLKMITPSGHTIQPWVLNPSPDANSLRASATRSIDTLNNAEHITWTTVEQGTYQILVSADHLETTSQDFVIAYNLGSVKFEWHHPIDKQFIDAGKANTLRWYTDETENAGKLYFRTSVEEEWNFIAEVSLSTNMLSWEAPDQTGLIQFKMVVDTEEYVSDFVALTKGVDVEVDYNCDNKAMISWSQDANADAYILWELAGDYFTEALTTVDTFAIVSKEAIEHVVSVTPHYDGKAGRRNASMDFTAQGVGCFFITVLPANDITSAFATVNIQLGTTYKLIRADLERKEGDIWRMVASTTSLSESFALTDEQPKFDVNTYRVRLLTVDDETIFSEELSVIIAGENSIFVYPNPAIAGTDVNLVVNEEDQCKIFVQNSSGKIVGFSEDFGPVKILPTIGLSPGLYIVRLIKSNGQLLHGKLVIQ